jgi:hypothetical protein
MNLLKWYILLDLCIGLIVYIFFDVESFIETYDTYVMVATVVILMAWKVWQIYKNTKLVHVTCVPIQLIEV